MLYVDGVYETNDEDIRLSEKTGHVVQPYSGQIAVQVVQLIHPPEVN